MSQDLEVKTKTLVNDFLCNLHNTIGHSDKSAVEKNKHFLACGICVFLAAMLPAVPEEAADDVLHELRSIVKSAYKAEIANE